MDTSIVDEASSPSSSSCFSNDEMYDSSSSCSSNDEILYDVFLSCGEDTRKTFTGHLYWRLKHARVDVFIADENKLGGPEERKKAIEQSMKAIEQSRIAVIILSREYAFSIGCLVELEKIMECRRTLGQMVLPIFYHVDPKDVGKQIDSFLVRCHGVKDWEEMMQSWRKSLIEAANLSGLGVKDWEEMMQSWRKSLTEAANLSDLVLNSEGCGGEFVGKIVGEITRKLKSACVDVATEQVELDSSMQEISSDVKVQVGKDSRLQEISTHLDVGGPKDAHIQLQGPRPSALKVNKESVKIKK